MFYWHLEKEQTRNVSVALKTYNEVKKRRDIIEFKLEEIFDQMSRSAKRDLIYWIKYIKQ